MPAKLVPYVVFMPKEWGGERPCEPDVNCDSCRAFSKIINNGGECPLASAKKAVECGYADSLGAHMIATPKGKAVTLWATELEENK